MAEGRLFGRSEHYPITTRVQKTPKAFAKSRTLNSVRDRGVGGSNPLAATIFFWREAVGASHRLHSVASFRLPPLRSRFASLLRSGRVGAPTRSIIYPIL